MLYSNSNPVFSYRSWASPGLESCRPTTLLGTSHPLISPMGPLGQLNPVQISSLELPVFYKKWEAQAIAMVTWLLSFLIPLHMLTQRTLPNAQLLTVSFL